MPRHSRAEDQKPAKVKRVTDDLRERINKGVWRPGDYLPSQKELAKFYGVSVQTVRDARKLLVGEGLIETSQGKLAQVRHRVPTHHFDIRPRPHDTTGEPKISTQAGDHVRREWITQDLATVPHLFGDRIGLKPDAVMGKRVMKLTIDDHPLLTSTSYVPADLSDAGDASAWRAMVDVGQLAVTDYAVTVEFLDLCSRMPNADESDELGMAAGVPLTVLSTSCQVQVGDRILPAGVIVRARSDRVCLRVWLEQSSPSSERPT